MASNKHPCRIQGSYRSKYWPESSSTSMLRGMRAATEALARLSIRMHRTGVISTESTCILNLESRIPLLGDMRVVALFISSRILSLLFSNFRDQDPFFEVILGNFHVKFKLILLISDFISRTNPFRYNLILYCSHVTRRS